MAKVEIDIVLRNKGAKAQIDKLRASTDKTTRSVQKLGVSLKSSTSAFKVFAGNIAAIGFANLTRGIASFAGSALDAVKEIEDLSTQFEVLTGSTTEANKALEDLTEFAAKTPFELADLARSQQRLLSFGFTIEESKDLLAELGDVAAASNADIGELSLIFGQVSAAGKLTGERLLQLQERAIPIGPALAESLGVAESAVAELVSQGKVDFETFQEAFKTLNDVGEFAFDGLAKRGRTLSARIDTLKESIQLFGAAVGTQSNLNVGLKAIVTTLTIFIEKIQSSAQFQSFLDFLSQNIPNALNFVVDSFSFVINTVLNTIKIFNLFRSGVTTALSVVIGAFTKFVDVYARVINALGLGDTALGRQINSINNFRTDVLNSLDATADGFAKAAADISASQESVNQAIEGGRDILLSTYEEERIAAEEQANAVVEQNNKQKTSAQQLTVAQLEEQKKREEQLIAFQQRIAQLKQEADIAERANELLSQEGRIQFENEEFARLTENLSREEQARIAARAEIVNGEQELATQLQEIRKRAADQEIQQRQRAKQQTENLERQKTQAQLGFAQAAGTALVQIAGGNNKALFALNKVFAAADIVVKGLQAEALATAQLGIFAPPAIAAIKTQTALQLATLAATTVGQIAGGSFEQGGIVPGSSFTGDRVVANVNSGEMILNRQQQAQLFQMANGQGSAQDNVTNITVELDGEVVATAVSRQVANGFQLGEVQ